MFLRRVPTVLIFVLSIALCIALFKPSTEPQIFIFSYFRASMLGFMALVAVYAAFSIRSPTLISVNNQLVYTVVVGLLIVEWMIRIYPSLLSDELIPLLPKGARSEIAAQRGFFTAERVTGKDMLFHWKPGTKFADKPWITIDKDGYRNTSAPVGETDVVLLGASVLAAGDLAVDLSARFSNEGLSAYSLAMGNYGPYHYRDAYRRYVIERGLKHRAVIIQVMTPYDLNKAVTYQKVLERGGNYKAFFNPPQVIDVTFPGLNKAWTLSILARLPQILIGKLRNLWNTETVDVVLDWVTVSFPKSQFEPPLDHIGWAPFADALQQIIALARGNGAVPIIVYYPNVSIRLAPFARLDSEARELLEAHVAATSGRMEKIVTEAGGRFVDVTEPFRKRSYEIPITTHPTDYHLNRQGMDLLFETIKPAVLTALER